MHNTEFILQTEGRDTWLLNSAGIELCYWNRSVEKINDSEINQVKFKYLQELCALKAPLALKLLPAYEDLHINPITTLSFLPKGSHPGAFGVARKYHIHEGVDIYSPENAEVYSMCDGQVVAILPFTGPSVNQPHWRDTHCVMVNTRYGVLNYGELRPHPALRAGMLIKRGTIIGNVERVLVNDKGRPLHMLHFERYISGTSMFVSSWELNTPKPSALLDPTLLLEYAFGY